MIRHYKSNHSMRAEKMGLYEDSDIVQCPECEDDIIRGCNLKRHFREVHDGVKRPRKKDGTALSEGGGGR